MGNRRPSGDGLCAFLARRLPLPGFVGTAAVDGWNLGTHGAEVDGELSAMMDGVVVDESEVEDGGEVEGAEEVDRGAELIGVHGVDAGDGALHVGVIPVHQICDGFGFFLEPRLHVEFLVGDFVGHLDVAGGEMPGEVPSGTSFGIGAVVALVVGDSGDDFFSSF